ncbi:dephospho-CoA kinase [bacterium]|nr:dephospho-CoA kinase [bacterium]
MLKIGITGGIGSGKSTVARMFMQLGIPVYEADQRARWLQDHEPLKSQIIEAFGASYYVAGKLNRAQLAQLVFNNKEKLAELNALVHPAVASDYAHWLSAQNAPYILKEAAIIFETHSENQYDYIILVTAPTSLRIERVMQRDKLAAKEVEARMKNQWSDEEKKQKAHFVIENTTLEDTQNQVVALHNKILELCEGYRKN